MPLWWYGDQEHLGYDVSGKKVMKKGAQDRIDQVLAAKDDPNHKWTVFDEKNDEKIVLSARELVLLRRILSGKAPHPEHNPTPEYIDFNTGPRMLHPVINRPPRKAAFVPSKWETMKINKIAAGIEEGRIKLDQEEEKEEVYMLWREDNAPHLPRHLPRRLPPPKMTLPGTRGACAPSVSPAPGSPFLVLCVCVQATRNRTTRRRSCFRRSKRRRNGALWGGGVPPLAGPALT